MMLKKGGGRGKLSVSETSAITVPHRDINMTNVAFIITETTDQTGGKKT
jgi:hypothetical protein